MNPISISRLKQIRCGTVQGYITGTPNKTLLYDSTGKIELIPWGKLPLKPGVLFQVKVDELVLGGCVPLRSQDHIAVVSSRCEPWRDPDDCTEYRKRLRSSKGPAHDIMFFVREKSNKIKSCRFFVNALVFNDGFISEVYIQNIKLDWFPYLLPGRFYYLIFEKQVNFNADTAMIDLARIHGEYSIDIIPKNSEECSVDVQQVQENGLFQDNHSALTKFTVIPNCSSSLSFINVRAQVLGLSSFSKSGFITFADSDNFIKNIAFTPARRVLPEFLIPGATVTLHQLLIKSVQNGAKQFLSVTHVTQIYLEALPTQNIDFSQIVTLSKAGSLQNRAVSVLVSMDCVLSLTINTIRNIHCKASVYDVSDSAILHLRDNQEFVREVRYYC